MVVQEHTSTTTPLLPKREPANRPSCHERFRCNRRILVATTHSAGYKGVHSMPGTDMSTTLVTGCAGFIGMHC
ncbi:MAG TPA: hypothetical protein PLL92_16650, partial [Alicycliphilus sp.]|nr:hypothetical protein [Alicycliphilus sp.]